MTDERCDVHPHVKLTKFCPACRGSVGGKATTPEKRAAVKENLEHAHPTGWPKGKPRRPK